MTSGVQVLDAWAIEVDGDEAYHGEKLVFVKSHGRVDEEAELLMSNSSFFITPIGIVDATKTLVLPFVALSKNLSGHLETLTHPSSLASEAVAYITWRLASAIAHLHDRGIAHTKLSSKCVLVTSNVDIKLCGLSSHKKGADASCLAADVKALFGVLRQLSARAKKLQKDLQKDLQKNSSFVMPESPAWLLNLRADASKYTNIRDVIHELERHNAHHGVVYVNDHHGARLSVAKAVTPSHDDASVRADELITATTAEASMPPTPATLSDLWAMYDVKELQATETTQSQDGKEKVEVVLLCTAQVEGTDGDVLLRRGEYKGKAVIIHRMSNTADGDFTQHIARVLWAQSDVYTPRVLGHAIVNSDKIANAALFQVQATVPCLVVDCDGLRSLHDVATSEWRQKNAPTWKHKITIARAILVGLLDFAARGVQHVNVTTQNVFLKPDLETPQFTNVGGRCKGASGVLPPELLPGGVGLTWTTDVFMFGMLLYEIAMSSALHRDEDREQARQTVLIMRGASGKCPSGFVLLIAACLHQLPAERPTLEATLDLIDHLLLHDPLDLAMDRGVNLIELDTTRLVEQSTSHFDPTTGTETIKGTYMSQKVLIKRPKQPDGSTDKVECPADIYAPLLREVSLLARVQSPFVVKLWGVAYFASSRPAVVFEHSSKDDNLWQLLLDTSFNRVLTDADRRLLLLGAAQGLGDVHERDWIHCDIRPENYLVGSHGQLQLGQFGAARHMYDTSTPLPTVSDLMLPFAAPEVLGVETFSKASDVYAFGALIAQLYTPERLFASSTLTSYGIREFVPQGLAKIDMPEACPAALKALAERCVAFEPSERPSMNAVVASLHELVRECTVASAPELQTHHAPISVLPPLPTVDPAFEFVQDRALLGQGAFGVVSVCKYQGTECALKQFQVKNSVKNFAKIRALSKFKREMDLLAGLTERKAKYVPRFIARVTGDPPAYLMEVVPGKNLKDVLSQMPKDEASFPWPERCRIALEIIKAIEELHNLGIEHLDLKSLNIMLTPENEIRIVDFGESVRMTDAAGYNEVANVGTWQWMAPEILAGRTVHATKADIYSFGIILSEIAMLITPYNDMGMDKYVLPAKVKSGLRPTMGPSVPERIRKLAEQCWSPNAEERPTAQGAKRSLELALSDYDDRRPIKVIIR